MPDDYLYKPLQNVDEESDNNLLSGDKEFDFDDILKHTVGEFGRYQQILICILCIPTCFLSAFATFDMVFIAYTPKYNCSLPEVIPYHLDSRRFRVDDKQCFYVITNGTFNETRQCLRFDYDKNYFQQSIVTEWNLVCDKALIARTIISLMNIAFLVAVMLYAYVQDRYGRKKAFILNLIIFLFGNIGSLNSSSAYSFTVFKFIAAINFMWRIGFVWSLEFVGPSKRTLINTILSVLFGTANVLLAIIAYHTQTWVRFGYYTSLPFAVLFLFAYHLPESPRWLISQGRLDETAEILERMALWDDKKIDRIKLRIILRRLKTDCSGPKSVGLSDFFRSKNLMYKNILLTFIIVAANQLYIALAYDSENLHRNFYVAYILQAAVEPPATLINLWLLNRFGRIWPLSLSLLISGTFCLLAWPLASVKFLHLNVVVLTSISRFFVCSSVAICEQLGSELYPTIGRGVGMSFSYVVTAIANISIQYIIYSSKVWKFLPLLIMGFFTFAAGLVSLFLPETKDKSLPDTVQQAEDQGTVSWTTFKENFTCNFNSHSPLRVDDKYL